MTVKSILSISLFILVTSCGAGYPFEGKVVSVDAGKDGYTAIVISNAGDTMSALMSRINMEDHYITVKAGDVIELDGDTMQLDNHLHIVARKVKVK